MEKLQMVLYGKSAYCDRLSACIRKHKPNYLEFMQYQNQAGDETIRADILLREEGTDAEVFFIERKVDIQLSRTKWQARNEKETLVFCYQKGQEILRQVFQIYQEHAEEFPVVQYRPAIPNMTVFYSTGGSDISLLCSMAYAVRRGQAGKVLYMNLSAFSGMLTLLEEKPAENLSDLFFAVQQRPDKFSMILQGLLHQGNQLDYIHPPENPSDLFEIRKTDTQNLIQMLSEQTDYDEIVWNCDSWNPVFCQLLQQSSTIFFLQRENRMSRYCSQETEQFLQKEVCGSFREKVQFVTLDKIKNNLMPGGTVWEQLQQGEWAEILNNEEKI